MPSRRPHSLTSCCSRILSGCWLFISPSKSTQRSPIGSSQQLFQKTRSTMCDRLFNRRDCCPIPSVYFARVAVIYMHHTLKFPPDYFCDSDLVAYTFSPNDSRIYRSTRISNIIFIYFEFCTAFRAILPKIFTHYRILRSCISLSKRNVE